VGGVAQGVAGDRVLQADDADDVARERLIDLLTLVGPDVVEPGAVLLAVAAGV
jgi:hypothetical protein